MLDHLFLLFTLSLFQFLPVPHLASAKIIWWNNRILDSADLKTAIEQAERGEKLQLEVEKIQLDAPLLIATDNVLIFSEHATKIECTGDGGAFEVEADGVQFEGIIFENCPQSVTVRGDKPKLTRFDDVQFIDNIAWDAFAVGGGIYLEGAFEYDDSTSAVPQAIVQKCHFMGNAAGVGGAIFAENFNLTVLDSTFEGNSAESGGGAVAVVGKWAECRVERSHFLRNSVDGTGRDRDVSYVGGVPIERLRYLKFPFPASTGGALQTQDVARLHVIQCTFDRNEATAGGALAHEISFAPMSSRNLFAHEILIQGSNFTENQAQPPMTGQASGQLGGAIYMVSAGNDVRWKTQDCTFYQNAAEAGGAVHLVTIYAMTPNIVNCRFLENSASRFGGAVLLRNTGGMKLIGCTFRQNSAGQLGGGILTTNNAMMLIEGYSGLPPAKRRGTINTFSENTAQRGGGIACVGCGDLTVRDALFEKNSAMEDGGGLYLFDSDSMIQILQSRFTGNQAKERGGGAAVEATGRVSFRSAAKSLKTIFEKNTAASGSAVSYKASHQKENRFRVSNAIIEEHRSIVNEGIDSGGTMQLALNHLPAEAIGDVLIYGVTLHNNKAIFGGGLSIAVSGDWNRKTFVSCPEAYFSDEPCRMLRLVDVNITGNEAKTAPGLYVSDGAAVGLTCRLSANQPIMALSDELKTIDSQTHAFDEQCSFFDNNFISAEDDKTRVEDNVHISKSSFARKK